MKCVALIFFYSLLSSALAAPLTIKCTGGEHTDDGFRVTTKSVIKFDSYPSRPAYFEITADGKTLRYEDGVCMVNHKKCHKLPDMAYNPKKQIVYFLVLNAIEDEDSTVMVTKDEDGQWVGLISSYNNENNFINRCKYTRN